MVQSIGRSRENRRRKRIEYECLVFWEGYLPEKAAREPAENLVGTADELLAELHKRYPEQPRA